MLSRRGPLFRANELENKIRAYNIKLVLDECATHDDLDKSMEQYLTPIKELSLMDHEDANSQAIRAIGFVRECLVVPSSKEVTRFHKRTDKKFDELLRELIHSANSRGEGVNRDGLQRALNYEAEKLEKRGLDDWFWQTREYLETLMEH